MTRTASRNAPTPPARIVKQVATRQAAVAPAVTPATAGQSGPSAPVPGPTRSAGADALAAWQQALIAWVDAHRAYPEAARRRGEQGAVGLRFTLTESGEVATADIQRGSGSTTLDEATLGMLRGAHLPPPPPGTEAARRTISVSIRYQLN